MQEAQAEEVQRTGERRALFDPRKHKRPDRIYVKAGVHKFKVVDVETEFSENQVKLIITNEIISEKHQGKKLKTYFNTGEKGGDYLLEFLIDTKAEVDLNDYLAFTNQDERLIGLEFSAEVYCSESGNRTFSNIGRVVAEENLPE